jgi:hypothetical protein
MEFDRPDLRRDGEADGDVVVEFGFEVDAA